MAQRVQNRSIDDAVELLKAHRFEGGSRREGKFYPQSLERGLRSERALLLAVAEMYLQGDG